MTKEQSSKIVNLREKLGIVENSAEDLELLLGVCNNLNETEIQTYLVSTNDFLQKDLCRICFALGVSPPKELTLENVKKKVADQTIKKESGSTATPSSTKELEKSASLDAASNFLEFIINGDAFSPVQLEQIVEAAKRGMDFESFKRMARPDKTANQMEKYMELYFFQQESNKTNRRTKK